MDFFKFLRVTEAAAIASSKWIGKMDKNAADGAAVDAMRAEFDFMDIQGVVAIGEGELDEAPMLYIGEKLGTGRGDKYDIAVDPLEGTELVAKGKPNAISVMAVGDWGCLMRAPDCYMDKIVVGSNAKSALVSLFKTPEQNLKAIADTMRRPVKDLTVCVLDRPRHIDLIKEITQLGAKISLISDGDVLAAIGVCMGKYDVLMGIGGAPEGVVSAAAVKSLGGRILGRLVLDTSELKERAAKMHKREDIEYDTVDMAHGEHIAFIATGVTDSFLLNGVIHNEVHSVILTPKERRFIKTTYG
jgi:fructose-1,6-bisphosphatase class II